MAMTKVERFLKMMNDIANCKSKEEAKKFKIGVLTDSIQNHPEDLNQADIEILREELDKLNHI